MSAARRAPAPGRPASWHLASADEEKQALKNLKREAGRLERARVKEVKRIRLAVERHLSAILARDIEVEARDELLQFTVPGVTKLVEVQNVLLDAWPDMPVAVARKIEICLEWRYADIKALPLPGTAPPVPDEDLEILGDF